MLINLLEFFQRLVGVGVGLEVGKVFVCPAVAPFMELDAFLDLLPDALLWGAVGGVESLVAAEGAATGAEGPVAVGAGEASGDADFLDTGAEEGLIIGTI